MLLEVRIGGGDKGAQTVFPGSVHECGEPIDWEEDGEPSEVDGEELVERAKRLAALCLFARHWPQKPKPGESGGRHDAALTVGGFLARCGVKPAFIKTYVEFIARAAKDEEIRDRMRAAEDGALAFEKGLKARGYPALKDLFGEKVAAKAAEWLDYNGARHDDSRADSKRVPPGAESEPGEAQAGALPIIDVRGGELSNLASQGEDILSAACVQIFQRSRQLVRPVIEEVDATRGRKTKICQLIPVVPDYLRDLLCRHARWERFDLRSKMYVPSIRRAGPPRPSWRARGNGGCFPPCAG
jgi:hypothetical protein